MIYLELRKKKNFRAKIFILKGTTNLKPSRTSSISHFAASHFCTQNIPHYKRAFGFFENLLSSSLHNPIQGFFSLPISSHSQHSHHFPGQIYSRKWRIQHKLLIFPATASLVRMFALKMVLSYIPSFPSLHVLLYPFYSVKQ